MAGEWIKMRCALMTCPRVGAIARAIGAGLGVDLPRQTLRTLAIGGLHAIWSAVNEHSSSGVMPSASVDDLDDIAGLPGIGAAMLAAGWLQQSESGLVFPNFSEWNTPGRDRTGPERQRRFREKTAEKKGGNGRVTDRNGDVTARNGVTVTTEKRREEKKREEEDTHSLRSRVSSGDARANPPDGDIQGIWETFRQAFNATPNAEPYNALGCPTAAFDIVTDPAFQTGYRGALDRLAASTFFDRPAPMTWFLRHWDRLLAGEFRERFGGGGKKKQRIVDLEEEPV